MQQRQEKQNQELARNQPCKQQVFNTQFLQTKVEVWEKENKRAIQTYNAMIEEHGLFADEHRQF